MVLILHGKFYSVILMGKEHRDRIEKLIASRSALILPLDKQLNPPPRKLFLQPIIQIIGHILSPQAWSSTFVIQNFSHIDPMQSNLSQ